MQEPLRMSRRHDETFIAGLHLPVAFLLIAIATLLLAWQGLSYNNVLAAAVLAGLGGFTVLVIGTSRMFLSGIAKTTVPLPAVAAFPAIAVTLGALLIALFIETRTPTGPMGALLWGFGVLMHILLMVAAVRSARNAARAQMQPRRSVRLLVIGAFLITVIAALWLSTAALSGGFLLPPIHLVLAGSITLAILVSLLVLVHRFTTRALPNWWGRVLVVTAPAGALLLALGIHTRSTPILHSGSGLMVITLLLAAYALFAMVRHARRFRPALILYALAAATVLTGTFLGAGVAYYQLSPRWVPLHGTLNLLGFMGALTFAASIDLYGPALRPGKKALLLHGNLIGALVVLSLVPFAILEALHSPYARYLLLLYAAAALLHAAAGIVRLRPAVKRRRARARS